MPRLRAQARRARPPTQRAFAAVAARACTAHGVRPRGCRSRAPRGRARASLPRASTARGAVAPGRSSRTQTCRESSPFRLHAQRRRRHHHHRRHRRRRRHHHHHHHCRHRRRHHPLVGARIVHGALRTYRSTARHNDKASAHRPQRGGARTSRRAQRAQCVGSPRRGGRTEARLPGPRHPHHPHTGPRACRARTPTAPPPRRCRRRRPRRRALRARRRGVTRAPPADRQAGRQTGTSPRHARSRANALASARSCFCRAARQRRHAHSPRQTGQPPLAPKNTGPLVHPVQYTVLHVNRRSHVNDEVPRAWHKWHDMVIRNKSAYGDDVVTTTSESLRTFFSASANRLHSMPTTPSGRDVD